MAFLDSEERLYLFLRQCPFVSDGRAKVSTPKIDRDDTKYISFTLCASF
jgi:hypothetical protein